MILVGSEPPPAGPPPSWTPPSAEVLEAMSPQARQVVLSHGDGSPSNHGTDDNAILRETAVAAVAADRGGDIPQVTQPP